jgi:hypothetical protein
MSETFVMSRKTVGPGLSEWIGKKAVQDGRAPHDGAATPRGLEGRHRPSSNPTGPTGVSQHRRPRCWALLEVGCSPGADIGPMNHFDPKRTVGLIASLPASGLESASPDTAITFQALLAERQMARAHSIFVVYR